MSSCVAHDVHVRVISGYHKDYAGRFRDITYMYLNLDTTFWETIYTLVYSSHLLSDVLAGFDGDFCQNEQMISINIYCTELYPIRLHIYHNIPNLL